MEKILILGGTQFIGRVFLEVLEKKYPNSSVTLFNRGKTNTNLFSHFNKIKGDRYSDDIFKITEEYWDVIIDFSCYLPENLTVLLPRLKNKVGRYIFISTVAVYDFEKATLEKGNVTEKFELLPYTSEMQGGNLLEYYGNKKAECERILNSHIEIDSIILRPSIVYGRYNIYERIYYWLYRLKNKPVALLPENGDVYRSYTFVDDLAEMIIKAMEIKEHHSTYNATSFEPASLKNILEEIKASNNYTTNLISIPREYVVENNVAKYRIPMWHIHSNYKFSNKKILKDFNINFHSIKDSFSKTIQYYEEIRKNDEGNIGLSIAHENAILFGYLLDQDEFETAKNILSPNCKYIIDEEILIGPEAILGSYEKNMIEGHKKLDVLEWGQSRVEVLNEQEFLIHFTDFLTHENKKFTHKCSQKITTNVDGLIEKIEHQFNEKEDLALFDFYKSVGIN